MLTAYDIEILTIASCGAPRWSDIDNYVPPPGELAALEHRGYLMLVEGQRRTIDRETGRASGYTDRWYEPTSRGERAVESAMQDGTLSAEARRLLGLDVAPRSAAVDIELARREPWRAPVERHPALPIRPIDYPGDSQRCGRCGWLWSYHSSGGHCLPAPLGCEPAEVKP